VPFRASYRKNLSMTLLLLPNLLGDLPEHKAFLPISVDQAVATIDGLIAESEKGGRRFLSRFQHAKKPHEIPIALLNKHNQDYDFLLEPCVTGEIWGLVSDAGLPCVADPGARLVARARQLGVQVEAFVGPSSILLALMCHAGSVVKVVARFDNPVCCLGFNTINARSNDGKSSHVEEASFAEHTKKTDYFSNRGITYET